MEALTKEVAAIANRKQRLPRSEHGYLWQEDLRVLIEEAIRLDYSLLAYDAECNSKDEPSDFFERAKWRDVQQAQNLIREWDMVGKLLVWVGNLHLAKIPLSSPYGEYPQMAGVFWERTGVEPFVIDQTFTVEWNYEGAEKKPLPICVREALNERGGTAGFIRGLAPEGLELPEYADAFLLSNDNKMIQEEPCHLL